MFLVVEKQAEVRFAIHRSKSIIFDIIPYVGFRLQRQIVQTESLHEIKVGSWTLSVDHYCYYYYHRNILADLIIKCFLPRVLTASIIYQLQRLLDFRIHFVRYIFSVCHAQQVKIKLNFKMGVSKLMQKNISTTYYNINVFKYAFCFEKSVCGFFQFTLFLNHILIWPL